jgi:hypothetical protein
MTNRPPNGPSPDRDDSGAASDARATALLAEVAATFAGTAPNIYRMLAANPAVLECLVRLKHLLERDGMPSTGEQAIVALIVADGKARQGKARQKKGAEAPKRKTAWREGTERLNEVSAA